MRLKRVRFGTFQRPFPLAISLIMPIKKEADSAASTSFEDALVELQDIVGNLEAGTTSLHDSIQQFERGVTLLKGCYQVLEGAEQRIEILTSIDRDGQPETEAFDASATIESETLIEDASPRKTKSKARGLGELPF